MSKPEIIGQEYNCETGEVTDIYADDAYYARQAAAEAEAQVREADAQAKATAKAALLSKLGITEDEAKLLLG